MNKEKTYDVAVIGGGASGSALLYTLAKYTDIKKIALIEKYEEAGKVNSAPENNSQTLHVGDIETNYTIDKVRQVKPASMMVAGYALRLPEPERQKVIQKVEKMLLAVGQDEVSEVEKRFEALKGIFPELKLLSRGEIAQLEPELMRGRKEDEAVSALFNKEGYAVNFGELARSLVSYAKAEGDKNGRIVDTYFGREVEKIEKMDEGYILRTKQGSIRARVVVVDTDAYSLSFAKSLGYGENFSLIPIAGTFYFTKELLQRKVYTMQLPGMPFAAVHGDPDLTRDHSTRFGPTARFFPVLEARNYSSMIDYFRSSGLGKWKTWLSFFAILLDPTRFTYLAKNVLYEFPYFGKYFFLPQVRKIVPSMRGRDLVRAKGYGGMRLQRVDTNTKELLLGEGKIVGDNIIFNMTPSPGASVCLYNAMRDVCEMGKFLKGEFTFDQDRMQRDLGCESLSSLGTTSVETSYPS